MQHRFSDWNPIGKLNRIKAARAAPCEPRLDSARLSPTRKTPGDLRPILLTLGQSFLVGLPRVFTATAATTIFLEHFRAAQLPYAYLLSGLLLAALGILYVRAERRFQLAAGVGTFALLAALLLVCRLLLARGTAVPLVAFALILLAEAEFTLTNVTFWGLANRVFQAREAASKFGLVSAGEVVPSVAGGLLIPWLVRSLGVPELLTLSVGAHLLSAGYLSFVRRALRGRLESAGASPEPRRRSRLRELLTHRYLVLAAALLCLNVVVFYFVDNAFYGAVQTELRDPVAVADFLGFFFVVLGVSSFVFKVLLAPRWRAWFGMRVALLTTPASLAVCCLIVLFAPALGGGPARLFAAVVLLKLLERIFIEGVHNPTYYALFQPLPLRLRTAAQNTIETVIAQGATLVAALVLLAVDRLEGEVIASILVAVTLGVLVVWLFAAFLAGREYTLRLKGALGDRPIAPRDVSEVPGLEAHLERWLRSDQVGQVLYGLRLARGARAHKLFAPLLALLDHPQPQVVEGAAMLLAEQAPPLAYLRLRERLRGSVAATEAVRVAWVRGLAATGAADAADALRDLLADRSPRVRAAAAQGLRRVPEGRTLARTVVEAMARSGDPAEREAAASVLGEDALDEQALTQLLEDSSIAVRRAAIGAAGKGGRPDHWPRLIASLDDPRLRPEAVRALGAIGAPAAKALAEAAPVARAEAKRALLALAAAIPVPATEALFAELLERGSREAAFEAVELLAERGEKARASWRPQLERRLADVVSDHARLTRALFRFRQEQDAELLVDALEGEVARCVGVVVSLLALLYQPELHTVGRQLQIGHTAEELGLSLEYLESVLPPEVIAQVRPVFAPLERSAGAGGDDEARGPELGQLTDAKEPWITDWIRGCAEEVARARSTGSRSTSAAIDRVTALWQLPLFGGVRGASLGRLALGAEERALHGGELVVEAGKPASGLILVLDGELQIDGAGTLGRGEAVNPLCVLDEAASELRASAVGSARVCEIRKDALDAVLRDDFRFGWQLLVALCRLLQPEEAARAAAIPEPLRGAAPPAESALLERMLALSGTELFHGLDEGILAALAEDADERCFGPGEVLLQEGELGTRMFVLAEGRARVERQGRLVATVGAPGILGELAALVLAPRAATVRAEQPMRALVIERSALFALLRAHPAMLQSLFSLLVRRIRASRRGSPSFPATRARAS